MPRLKGVRQRGRSFFYRIRTGGADRTIALGRDLDLAVKQALEIRRRLKAGLPPTDERASLNPASLRFGDLEQMLLDDYRAQQRRSIDVVDLRLRYLREHFAQTLARDISFDLANAYVAKRLGTARRSTVRYELALLNRMLRLAHRAGKLDRLPPLPSVAVGDNARKGFCAPEEIDRVIAHLPAWSKPVVQALYVTGWRTGEILGLEWRRVDFKAQTFWLDSKDSKSGKPRVFPFGALPELVEILRVQRTSTASLERVEQRVIPWVFHRNGSKLGSIRSGWRKAALKAGLPGLTPHDLRRSAARNLVRAGVPEDVVMRLCGWSTRSMLSRYNITAARDLEEGVARLADYLKVTTGTKAGTTA
jgi:integrase